MKEFRRWVNAAREKNDPSLLTNAIPYCRFLGLSLELIDGELIGKLKHSDSNIGNPVIPALHGGVTGALIESTAVLTLLWTEETAILPKTINITLDYLRTARAVDTFASATITKHGRRVVNVSASAWQGDDRDKPIISGSAHFLVAG